MATSMSEIMKRRAVKKDPTFPHAPADWNQEAAKGSGSNRWI
jgi:hypothetical protein